MTNKQLEALCRLWQGRLRLLDWDIRAEFKRFHEMQANAGMNEINEQHKTSTISILAECDSEYLNDGLADFSVEHTLVHELVHLHCLEFEPEQNSRAHIHFELMINTLTSALIESYED
jgi:hypothetical protein